MIKLNKAARQKSRNCGTEQAATMTKWRQIGKWSKELIAQIQSRHFDLKKQSHKSMWSEFVKTCDIKWSMIMH